MAGNRTKSVASLKPDDGFPLTAHRGANQWCKKCRSPGADKSRTFYFGPLADWKAALERYQREWPYIIEGKTPPPEDEDACTVRVLCNLFLEGKRDLTAANELTELSYRDYYRTCGRLIDYFGAERRVDDLRPPDFQRY